MTGPGEDQRLALAVRRLRCVADDNDLDCDFTDGDPRDDIGLLLAEYDRIVALRSSPPDVMRAVLARELNISSDHDFRAWKEIKRALATLSGSGTAGGETSLQKMQITSSDGLETPGPSEAIPASESDKLLPCPFCGGNGAITLGKSPRGINTIDIICQDCSGTMPAFCETDAVEDWNRRAPAPRQDGDAVAPCPVCHSNNIGTFESQEGLFTVCCENDACEVTVEVHGGSLSETIERWNIALRRAHPPQVGDAREDDRQWLINRIRDGYDPAPSYFKLGDNWNDGTEEIADEVIKRFAAPVRAAAEPGEMREHGFIKPDNNRQVFFYEQDFYVLSNFSSFRLLYRGHDFDTSEHAYHWAKFMNVSDDADAVCGLIKRARSAHIAFKIAGQYKHLRRPDWDGRKINVMREILRAKADQHEYVRNKLLTTGDRELIEDSWRDDFWGWGPNRDGKNMLGKLWMEIRADQRSALAKASPDDGDRK